MIVDEATGQRVITVISESEMTIKSEIEQLIERFVSRTDTSIEAANEIEAALDDGYPDDDYVQQTVRCSPCTAPGVESSCSTPPQSNNG